MFTQDMFKHKNVKKIRTNEYLRSDANIRILYNYKIVNALILITLFF